MIISHLHKSMKGIATNKVNKNYKICSTDSSLDLVFKVSCCQWKKKNCKKLKQLFQRDAVVLSKFLYAIFFWLCCIWYEILSFFLDVKDSKMKLLYWYVSVIKEGPKSNAFVVKISLGLTTYFKGFSCFLCFKDTFMTASCSTKIKVWNYSF